jgi:hypothetical protein
MSYGCSDAQEEILLQWIKDVLPFLHVLHPNALRSCFDQNRSHHVNLTTAFARDRFAWPELPLKFACI